MTRFTMRQVKLLLSEMENYQSENHLHKDEIVAYFEGPAHISISDMGWDERETYGKHTDSSPKIKEVSVS